MGFDLATIESSAENQFVLANSPLNAWLGITDSAVEGAWRQAFTGVQFWQGKANGSAIAGAYTNWKSGQPDDLLNQDCGIIQGSIGLGKWSDESCSLLASFVCEGDLCPSDPNKTDPGQCGCGNSDLDSDGDGTANCNDVCPSDVNKIALGVCGCGQADTDTDGDGVPNCKDLCPNDRNRLAPGDCGCSDAAKPSGTACNDGLCAANTQCDGAGSCGAPSQCAAPDSQCSFAMRAGSDYWFCNNLRNFSDARQRCKNAGMDLAAVRSADEDNFIKGKLLLSAYLGGSDQTTEGEWSWLSTGQPFWTGGQGGHSTAGAYTNWQALEPSELLGTQDCLVKDPLLLGQWAARSCTLGTGYVCKDVLAPFVNCISKVGEHRYAALFGYDNHRGAARVVPGGLTNFLSPTPANPQIAPVTDLAAGRNDHAFWVPFDDTAQIAWTLEGVTATANASSPLCTSAAYPAPPADPVLQGAVGGPESPSRISSLRGKLAPDFNDAAHQMSGMNAAPSPIPSGAGSTTMVGGVAVTSQALTGPGGPFTVTITRINLGDDGSLDVTNFQDTDVNVVVDGEDLGSPNLYICSFSAEPCPHDFSVMPNRAFTKAIPEDQATVPVTLRILEQDPFDTDHELTVNLTVDNLLGTWTGTADDIDGHHTDLTLSQNCFTAPDGWGLCWTIDTTGVPTDLPQTKICVDWNTDFVDEGLGEDVVGTPVPSALVKTYPASFAEFAVNAESAFGASHVGGDYADNNALQPNSPPRAFLDADGCLPAGAIPARNLLFRDGNGLLELSVLLRTNFFREPGTTYTLMGPQAFHETAVFRFSSADPKDIDLNTWTLAGHWRIPPAELHVRSHVIDEFTHIGAVIGRLLTAQDSGIVPGQYDVFADDGCLFSGEYNSCVDLENHLLIGPALKPPNSVACNTDSECVSSQMCLPDRETGAKMCHWPSQARWKYVIAHEAGHQIQALAMGMIGVSYTFSCPAGSFCPGKREGSGAPQADDPLVDPPFADPLCGCQHVTAANAQHCLQSIEDPSAAHAEGYAQFYASKAWNRADQADCSFSYYKEFLLPPGSVCPPGGECLPFATSEHGTLLSQLPPLGVDCKTPFQKPSSVVTGWRNSWCPVSDAANFATERDIMGFLWNVNTGAATQRSSMDHIFSIYRHACNPSDAVPGICKDRPFIQWTPAQDAMGRLVHPGFAQGAQLEWGLGTPQSEFINQQARAFSVTPELPATP